MIFHIDTMRNIWWNPSGTLKFLKNFNNSCFSLGDNVKLASGSSYLSTIIFGCNSFLMFISCKFKQLLRVSFVLPLKFKIDPKILSYIFLSMCIKSKLCLNNHVFQYGKLKKTLFLFQLSPLFSCDTLIFVLGWFVRSKSSTLSNMLSPDNVFGDNLHSVVPSNDFLTFLHLWLRGRKRWTRITLFWPFVHLP